MEDAQIRIRLQRARAEVRRYWDRRDRGEATPAEDPQHEFAAQFFDYAMENPATESSREALEAAFTMWGNIPSAEAIDSALPRLDPSSSVWDRALRAARNAYARSDRPPSAWGRLLHSLEPLVEQHPRSRSVLDLQLGEHYLERDPARAREYFEEVVRLAASAAITHEARGALRELDDLALGRPAPDFSASDIGGRRLRLADHRGKVVLIAFWAPDSGACLAELPSLRALHAELDPEKFQLIGVVRAGSSVELRRFCEREGLGWPQVLEPVSWQDGVLQLGAIGELYNVYGVPRTFLVDQQGRISAKALWGEALRAAARELVARQTRERH